MPIVTAYDTLGQEGLTHSLKQTNSKIMFLDPSLLPKLMEPLKAAPNIDHLVYDNNIDVKQAHIDALKKEYPKLNIISLDDLIKLGEENPVDRNMPDPEDLACIMYTSGSTGPPKGVLLKHRNIIASRKPLPRALAGNPCVAQFC